MSAVESSRVLIVGPSPDRGYVGGVATHVRVLKSLSALQKATVLDPGSFNSSGRTSVRGIIRGLYSLRGEVRTGKFDVVLMNVSIYSTSILKMLLILSQLPLKRGPAVRVFFHGGRFEQVRLLGWRITRSALRPLFKRVRSFHFLGDDQEPCFRGMFPTAETELYENYASTDMLPTRKRSLPDSVLRLLFVGRIDRRKGIFELLSAIEALSGRLRGRVSLRYVGDGPDLKELKRKASALGPEVVEFTGFLSGASLEAQYQESDVLILPSYSEAFPYVVIEAMRAGMPVVSTGSGALNRLVKDGQTGWIVRPQDVKSIIRAVEGILQNRAILDDMAGVCQRYFADHLSKSSAERYYSELLSRDLQFGEKSAACVPSHLDSSQQ